MSLGLGRILWNAKYKQNDQVAEDEMGGACSTNGGEDGTRIGSW
jgi:hypothetical protein